jgi:phage tail sheath protein FI
MLCVPDAVFVQPPDPQSPKAPPLDPCAPTPAELESAAAIPGDPTSKPASITEEAQLYIQRSMIEQCDRLRDRVAILDPPPNLQPVQMQLWPEQKDLRNPMGKFAALYYPWLKAPDALSVAGPNRPVPPCGHVAGIYARTDHTFGVQKPPANEALEFAADTVLHISDLQQEGLNDLHVNCLRSFPGRGIRVWGARSLSTEAQWKYIHTRRLMSMVEESVDKSARWTVFEQNDEALRRTLVHSLSVFLEGIWRRGGLKGATPALGFFVKCDETNNPQSLIDLGMLVCQVGLAIAAPMEFLVFEIRRTVAGSEIVES